MSSSSAQATDLPVAAGAAVGLVTWLLGYAITYIVVAPDVRDSPLQRFVEAFEGEPATYEMVGWVFYNAHFANTVFRDLPIVGSHTTSFVGGEEGFAALLYLVPIVTLLAGGFALTKYQRIAAPARGATVELTVLPGYLVASLAGAFLFEVTIAGATGAPDLLPAVFLAGIVYPLVFAGGGGAIAGALETRAGESATTSRTER
ncbi:hypothetical protein RBH26_11505 [Natronolimnohabitans sp. A-GB9]|uniref:hypothetical protein n=1 Tax=Natronolimnohabitans sp. A-GB9 TaxID=3069757 RepID=UPI0027B0B160|nr:hypothetical protein [Natronolimnohabitans sp. A-GB9]MDQ2051107.1 hypothetical protein [Natronolimnohabitans sp. A-GB9]